MIHAGDRKSLAIAAASVVAKVVRDRMMVELHLEYPQYGFDRHKGYGVPQHLEALKKHGPCPHHRKTFAPIRFMGERRGEMGGFLQEIKPSRPRQK